MINRVKICVNHTPEHDATSAESDTFKNIIIYIMSMYTTRL